MELAEKHEAELRHMQEQHEHDKQCSIDHKADELRNIHEGNKSQMEKLRQNITELLKAFDDAKQIEIKAIQENHHKELQIIRDSKSNDALRAQKNQTELIKTHNSQMMKIKLEFSMKEAIYKNKIKKMEEAHEKKIQEINEMHENQQKKLNQQIEEMGCEHSKKIIEM